MKRIVVRPGSGRLLLGVVLRCAACGKALGGSQHWERENFSAGRGRLVA